MKIYTRTGDRGKTSLWGGKRVDKNAARLAAYGTVDELNALLGVVRCLGIDAEFDRALERIQHELFVLGADLAAPENVTRIERMNQTYITRLEQEIDAWEEQLPPLREFILPSGSQTAAYLHLARTVCRRAERELVDVSQQEPVNEATQAYLNRLSDWLFVLARLANTRAGIADVPWRHP